MTTCNASLCEALLLLEQLVPHGKEGDGQAGAKEDDEVEGQLVPE